MHLLLYQAFDLLPSAKMLILFSLCASLDADPFLILNFGDQCMWKTCRNYNIQRNQLMGMNNSPGNQSSYETALGQNNESGEETHNNSALFYESFVCYFMEIIEDNMGSQDEISILIYQIYMKMSFDKLLSMGYWTNDMLSSGMDSILINFAKIIHEATKTPILGLYNDQQILGESDLLTLLINFQELKQRLQNYFTEVKTQIPDNHFSAVVNLIALALTKSEFYNCSCEQLLKSCFKWLVNKYSLPPSLSQSFQDQIKDFSGVFDEMVEELALE